MQGDWGCENVYDAISAEYLDEELVMKAREFEMETF